MSNDLNGRTTSLAGLYGTLLEGNNLSYSMQTGYAGGGEGNSGGTGYAALNYRGGYGNANVGYSRSDGIKQLYYGLSGGVLAHADGVTLSQPMNDTVVLIKAPPAQTTSKWKTRPGFRPTGAATPCCPTPPNTGKTGWRWTPTAWPITSTWTMRWPAWCRPTAPLSARNLRPTSGLLLMSLIYNGKPVPFGALVTSDGSQASSIVADNGQVYLSGCPWRAKCGRNGAKVRTPAARLTTACRRKNRTSC